MTSWHQNNTLKLDSRLNPEFSNTGTVDFKYWKPFKPVLPILWSENYGFNDTQISDIYDDMAGQPLEEEKEEDDDFAPLIEVSALAEAKMSLYIELCPDEIGWLGLVRKTGHSYLIEDVILFDQAVNRTTTEIDPESIAKVACELITERKDRKAPEKIRCWGHSHVYMGVFASGQDDHQMDVFGNDGTPYMVRLIANKYGVMNVDFYNYEKNQVWNHLGWSIAGNPIKKEEYESLKNEVQIEIAKKVRRKTWNYVPHSSNLYPEYETPFYNNRHNYDKSENDLSDYYERENHYSKYDHCDKLNFKSSKNIDKKSLKTKNLKTIVRQAIMAPSKIEWLQQMLSKANKHIKGFIDPKQ